MCCILCKQKCFVLAQKAAKEVTFVLLFQRGAELLAFWGMMGAKKGCIGMKTNRWITSWHVVCFLISRWQPTVLWPMGDDDFLRWTSGAFFCTRESISWAESICPAPSLYPSPFVLLWVINENEEARRSEEPLISLDLLWIINLWPCVIYSTLVTCFSHNFLHKEIPSHISYWVL